MEANKILTADILDIIFEGKNKLYGAYQLRKSYNERLTKAMIVIGILLILVIAGTVIAGSGTHQNNMLVLGPDIILNEYHEELTPPPVFITPPAAPVNNQVKYTQPVIVNDDKVRPEDIIHEITDDITISSQTIKTDITTKIIQAPVADSNSHIVQTFKNTEDNTHQYIPIEIPASFPGGFAAWKKYLEKNLDPETAINNGAPEGMYTVMVRFIVSKDGTISEVIPETKLGYGLEAEAIKIIKKCPKWIPAIQNGQHVTAYRLQPISFVVSAF